MRRPTLQEEKKLLKKGYRRIAGVDEAGRGPLAGPVFACAILIKNYQKLNNFSRIRDSKKLSAKKREEFYRIFKKHPAVEWGIGRASERTIDRINILVATKLAMVRAVSSLEKKMTKVDFLILDGNMLLDLAVPQKAIIKGDEKVFSCALASIFAKVTRDRFMDKQADKYPVYRFEQHKGYPTKLHRRLIKRHGPAEIHRKTFKLV